MQTCQVNIGKEKNKIIGIQKKLCISHGTIVNNPEAFSFLNASISLVNESDNNFEDNLLSVELFVNR